MLSFDLPAIGPTCLDETARLQLRKASAACRRLLPRAGSNQTVRFQFRGAEPPPSSPTAAFRRRLGAKYTRAQSSSIERVMNGLAYQHGVLDRPILFDDTWVRAIHGKLTTGNPAAHPGRFRNGPVRIGKFVAPPAREVFAIFENLRTFLDDCPAQLHEFCEGDYFAAAIARASLVHAAFLRLHPFTDGNGRTARAMDFAILVADGVPPWIAEQMHLHYLGTRYEYCNRLQAVATDGVSPFVAYAAQGLSRRLELFRASGNEYTRRTFLRAGHSLLELLAVIGIVGTISAMVIPRVFHGTSLARQNSERVAVGMIRSAIERYSLVNGSYPAELDSAANTISSDSNPLFAEVLEVGDTGGEWSKISSSLYAGPTGTAYQYQSTTGLFVASAAPENETGVGTTQDTDVTQTVT